MNTHEWTCHDVVIIVIYIYSFFAIWCFKILKKFLFASASWAPLSFAEEFKQALTTPCTAVAKPPPEEPEHQFPERTRRWIALQGKQQQIPVIDGFWVSHSERYLYHHILCHSYSQKSRHRIKHIDRYYHDRSMHGVWFCKEKGHLHPVVSFFWGEVLLDLGRCLPCMVPCRDPNTGEPIEKPGAAADEASGEAQKAANSAQL